jgi:hypothetical protein
MPVSWDWRNWYKGMWDPEDRRLFPPKRFGIGWTFNFRELLRRLRVVSSRAPRPVRHSENSFATKRRASTPATRRR